MSLQNHFSLLASYNRWMNVKLYEAAGKLGATELALPRGAFFGSLLGTLNHLMVADRIWLSRFAEHPAQFAALENVRNMSRPTQLDEILHEDFAALESQRTMLDLMMLEWVATLTDADLAHVLEYKNTKGVASRKRFSSLLLHFFNHQTHHRGQATTLFSQAGLDVGVTDLLMLIPEEVAPE